MRPVLGNPKPEIWNKLKTQRRRENVEERKEEELSANLCALCTWALGLRRSSGLFRLDRRNLEQRNHNQIRCSNLIAETRPRNTTQNE